MPNDRDRFYFEHGYRTRRPNKLTPADRDEIARLYLSGNFTQAQLAQRYAVSAFTIGYTLRNHARKTQKNT